MRLKVIACGIAFLALACGTDPQVATSELDQINGKIIEETEFPAVVWIGNCTGTFVSDTTLITAAHCVRAPNRTTGVVNQTISLPRQGDVKSLKVLANVRSNQNVSPHDSAIVIFPPGTAKATMPLHRTAAKVGDKIMLVGYGGEVWGGRAGTKRKGTNELTEVARGYLISERRGNNPNSGEGVAVAPGDSGGPLFIDNALAGIASGGGLGSNSIHVDLQSDTSKAFLELAVKAGAVIPGVGGTPDGSSLDQAVHASLALVDGQDADQVQLEAAAKAGVAKVVLCQTAISTACDGSTSGAVQAAEHRRQGERSIYRFSTTLRLTEGTTYTLAAIDDQGKVVGRQRLQFARQ